MRNRTDFPLSPQSAINARRSEPGLAPALRKLHALSTLDQTAVNALNAAIRSSVRRQARSELFVEGQLLEGAFLLVKGWAARVRYLRDGRRQILSLLIPGDLIGAWSHDGGSATSTVVTLTDVSVCHAPSDDVSPSLRRAYAMSSAIDEVCLLSQITRLGRLNALEKLCDLMLELHERLELIDEVRGGTFDFPLTQQTLGDVLGLTAVHVNRTAQNARHADLLEWKGKQVHIKDPKGLSAFVDRTPIQVIV